MVMRKRPIFRIKLAVDQLNLDGYLLKDKSITQPSKPLIIKPASAQLNTERGKKILKKEILPTFFIPKNIDVNLNMKFNNFVAERTMFNGITLRAQISNGRLNLSKLRIANVAGMTVNVSGKIRQSQKTLGLFENEFENLSFNVRGKSPQRILSILNIKPPISARKIGALEISGNLRGKPSSFKILANLSLFGGVYGLDGTVEPLRKLPRISGKFSIRHPNLKMLVNKLGVLYQPTKKDIGPIKLGGNLDGTTELINFSGLSGEIGGVKIKGDVVAKFDERSPRINADLKTGVIILDNFLGAEKNIPSKLSSLDIKNRKYQEFSNRSLFTNASFNGLSREKTSHPMFIRSVTKILAIGAPWKSEPIDFSFLRGFSGDIKLRTKRLRIKNYTIDDIDLKSLCTDGVIDLKRLTGRMYDGTIELDGRLIAKEANSQIKTRFKVINANTGKLLSSLDTRGFRKGALDIASEFRTQGSSTLDFIRALNGGGTISIRGLEFDSEAKKGSPLSGFANLFFSLQQFSGVILGKKSISKRTNFNTNFRTEKGIIRFEDMTIKTGFGNGAAKGSVDLSNWRINTTGEIELSKNVFAQLFLKNIDKPKLLPFKIKGRLDNPNVKLETVALTKGGIVFPSIVNKKLDGLVRKKGVNKILENLFPQNDPNNERIKNNERKPTIPKKPKDYHNKRVNTKDVLKGILRELAR